MCVHIILKCCHKQNIQAAHHIRRNETKKQQPNVSQGILSSDDGDGGGEFWVEIVFLLKCIG